MRLHIRVNETVQEVEIDPGDSLLKILRRLGYFGVKFGDEHGMSGADTVLLDGKPVNSGLLLAAQAEGHAIQTIESVGQHPEQGWKTTEGLHPLQKAFIASGAIQCGYCTPAQILAAQSLLARNAAPSEAEIREALSGVLCRCTGYVKPVHAVLRAAEIMRRESNLQPRPGVNKSFLRCLKPVISRSAPLILQALQQLLLPTRSLKSSLPRRPPCTSVSENRNPKWMR
jgi:putative selenate reductase molybdopterin-binding subunit